MSSKYSIFKYCPACGDVSIIADTPKSIRCFKCDYVYFHNTASSVAAIIENNSSILLTIRANEPKKGMYDLPGGFVDYNESLEDALRREIFEELGVNIKKCSYLCSFPNEYIFKGVTYFTVDTFFVCILEDRQKIVSSSEILKYEWIHHSLLRGLSFAFESNIRALEKYLQKKD
ncbi:MAG: NUDIX domain-containing protein [Chitinispirillaceae bacterium]|nr:NUDIX domain-containing protein [Chitinispirillaceae bacterium]